MRVLFVNTIEVWGGGELWTLETALGLARRGHSTSLLAANSGKLLERARAAGISSQGVPAATLERWLQTRELRIWLRECAPEIVVANSGADVRLAQRLCGAQRVPLVLRRGLDRPIANGAWRRRSFRDLDAIIANSSATRATLQHSLPWYPPERVHVIHNGIDAARFLDFVPRDVRAELGIATQAFVIGMIGRLSAQKGHRTLFAAMPRLVAARPDVQLLIVGTGELELQLRRQVERNGHAARCRFVGHADAVQPYYAACDAIAIPSEFEGFCFTAVEAQLLECPVVASNASSLPEVVADGVGGYLVPPGDADALAERMLLLAGDTALRRRLGAQGRAYVQERFSAAAAQSSIEALFQDMLKSED